MKPEPCNPRLQRLILAVFGLLALVGQSRGASVSTVFYDISFSSPPHTVGSRPTYGSGPDTPSSNFSGSPEVVAAYGPLTDQPVVLNTEGNTLAYYYDQFRLDLGFNEKTYHLSFDLYTKALVGSRNGFAVIFDSQPLMRLDFLPSGNLYPFGRGESAVPFSDEVPLRVDVSFDRFDNRFVTLIDGTLVSEVRIVGSGTPSDLKSIRFALGTRFFTDANDPGTSVAIDNIRVTNGFAIPEGAVAAKFTLAAVFALGIRSRRRILL
jgi:hypothetical protein